MPLVVRASGFNGEFVNVNHPPRLINVSRHDLVRGMLTFGRSGWRDVFKGGIARLLEMGGLALEVCAYTERELTASGLFTALNPSEKGTVSYRLGMAIAKVVAEVELNIPWLQHLDPLIRDGRASLRSGSLRRGDLAGQDIQGRWHVIEAKGRSNPPSPEVLNDAKSQASRIELVDGVLPATRCACVADLSSAPFSVDLVDPEGQSREPVSLILDTEMFFEVYYEPIRFLQQAQFQFEPITFENLPGSPRFRVAKLIGSDFQFGVVEDIFQHIRGGAASTLGTFLYRFASRWIEVWRERPGVRGVSFGLDGYVVILKDPYVEA